MLIGNPQSAAAIVRVASDLRDKFSPSMTVFEVLRDIAHDIRDKWRGIINIKRAELGMHLEHEIVYDLVKDFGYEVCSCS